MLNEGLDNSSTAEGIGSHHEHLILVHSVEERSHIGSDRLLIKKEVVVPNFKTLLFD